MAANTLTLKTDATTTAGTLLVDSTDGGTTIMGCSKIIIGADDTNDGFVSSANPLPVSGTLTVTGVATAANQTTIIGHVDGIEGLLTTIDTDTGNIATSAASIDAKTPALGQALAAASVPVVLTADQLTTLTPPAAITGFATETTLAALNTKVTAVDTGAVVVSSSALPSGAATAAKQPALGTAGSASTDVITVQGIASMTALKVDGSAVTQPVSGTFWQATQPVSVATIPSHDVTNAGTFAVQAAQSGTWTVQPGNTANTTAWLVTGTGGTFPVTDSGGSLTVDNNGTFAVQAVCTNAGTFAVQSTIAAAATNIAKAEDAASADADVGVPAMAVRKATPANTSGTDGDYEMLQMSAGRLWVDASGVTLTVGSHAVTNAGTFAVQSSLETSSIYNGSTALTPKFAAIAVSSSGNNTLVSAVVGKKIRVLAYNLIGNGAVNAKFQSGASGTDLTGLKYIAAAGGGICAPFNPLGWFETASNTLLNLNLSGAVAVGGELVYCEV